MNTVTDPISLQNPILPEGEDGVEETIASVEAAQAAEAEARAERAKHNREALRAAVPEAADFMEDYLKEFTQGDSKPHILLLEVPSAGIKKVCNCKICQERKREYKKVCEKWGIQ